MSAQTLDDAIQMGKNGIPSTWDKDWKSLSPIPGILIIPGIGDMYPRYWGYVSPLTEIPDWFQVLGTKTVGSGDTVLLDMYNEKLLIPGIGDMYPRSLDWNKNRW